MSAVIIDGKQIAADVRADVAKKTDELKKKGINPCLAVILVGENPASVSYVTRKRKALAEVGMIDRSLELPEGKRKVLNLLEGGSGTGEIKLYKHIGNTLEQIEHATLQKVFCEFGHIEEGEF